MRRDRGTREVRPWHVWRRAFWTRAGFFAAYAVLAIAAAGLLVVGTRSRWHEVQVIQAHHTCGSAVEGGCLERVTGQLSGPFPSGGRYRGIDDTWRLDRNGHRIDAFVVTLHDSALLAHNDRNVSALVYDHRVVIVELADGHEVTASTDSWRAVVLIGCVSLALLAVAVGFWRYARKKRRSAGSWWSVTGPEAETKDIAAFVAFMVPLTVGIAVIAGVDWRLVAAVAAPALGVLAWWELRNRRRPREPDLPGLTRRR